jgi:hypothetical protein
MPIFSKNFKKEKIGIKIFFMRDFQKFECLWFFFIESKFVFFKKANHFMILNIFLFEIDIFFLMRFLIFEFQVFKIFFHPFFEEKKAREESFFELFQKILFLNTFNLEN